MSTLGQVRRRESTAASLSWTLLALLLLAATSLGFHYVHLASYALPVALAIAAFKAMLVGIFFMELLHERASVRLAFAAGLALFALLVALVVGDVITRSGAPLAPPPGAVGRARG